MTSKDPTAVVTGAASGIGKAVLQLLLARHVRVIAVDVNQEALADLARNPAVKPIALDLADADQRNRLREEAGEVDYLVNCAGLIRLGPIADFDLDSWRQIFAVNAEAVFFVSQALTPTSGMEEPS